MALVNSGRVGGWRLRPPAVGVALSVSGFFASLRALKAPRFSWLAQIGISVSALVSGLIVLLLLLFWFLGDEGVPEGPGHL